MADSQEANQRNHRLMTGGITVTTRSQQQETIRVMNRPKSCTAGICTQETHTSDDNDDEYILNK